MINKEWHIKNRMVKNASLEQRIAWHIEHKKECACREMPKSIQAAIMKKK